MSAPPLDPVDEAQDYLVQQASLVAAFGNLAAGAAAAGDPFGASWNLRIAHEHVRESWRAQVHWRNELEARRKRGRA